MCQIKFIVGRILDWGAKPGIFKSIFYEKSKQKINDYKDIKRGVDEFINEIIQNISI